MKLSTGIFKASSPIRATSKGSAGYDNARENIDPHLKTKVLSSREGSVEKVPTDGHDIVNKTYCDSNGVPSGLIAMWHGLIANIPTGWMLCDGNHGTPDLRSKFVKGAPAATEAGGTGGASTHTHTFTGNALAGHTHTFTGNAMAGHLHEIHMAEHGHDVTGSTSSNTSVSYNVAAITTILRYATGVASQIVVSGINQSDPGHVHTADGNLAAGALSTVTIWDSESASAGTPAGSNSSTSGGTPAGSNSTESNVPPYYEILFIMKS